MKANHRAAVVFPRNPTRCADIFPNLTILTLDLSLIRGRIIQSILSGMAQAIAFLSSYWIFRCSKIISSKTEEINGFARGIL